ncbi:MAG: chromosomal replication initiator protein DnaA [Deferribacteres bacterium]|nr:chromosomal replication initiator protein DnaA [candidate division KSB1 bacterium]MCB9502912.1 chromosomal replication initiator protein DnaA [Deferribacteres bacterium]
MENAAREIWNNCLMTIQNNISEQSFHTWIKPIKALKIHGSVLTIQVPSEFFKKWLQDNYYAILLAALRAILGNEASYQFEIVASEEFDRLEIPEQLPTKISSKTIKPNYIVEDAIDDDTHPINDRYTFENYVEGSSNQFAKAAAIAVAESPGKTSFNPLVIYGGVGLGKTHLIQAIGNFSVEKGIAKNVMYVSSERFTMNFINSIQRNKTTEFSELYRNVDLLLVDDIQFFSNKERTQEEFFHTFNTLHQNGKQIVLSSDRPPKDITGIEERLLSRFQWGLVADIQPPDLETRIAILQKKAELSEVELDKDVVQLIAYNVTSNIRELEGALVKLLAHASLRSRDINLLLAKEVLKDVISQKQRNITIDDILKIVANYYHIPEDFLKAKTRKKEVALARQIAMYMSKQHTKHSLKTIGLHFGGRDHSTVIHAINSIEENMKQDKVLSNDLGEINKKINLSSI